ncbi:hypothetical protein LBMAG20_01560 [Methylocystaceae bacterium]|nr:hypothetical protein LBMAG20_01560 [Methylocystaceae bacterium]
MRLYLILSIFFSLAFISSSYAQGAPGDKDACEPDAYRLCDDAVPDAVAVEKCLKAHMKNLSSACKKRFAIGAGKK